MLIHQVLLGLPLGGRLHHVLLVLQATFFLRADDGADSVALNAMRPRPGGKMPRYMQRELRKQCARSEENII